MPLVHSELPPQPGTPAELATLIITEMLIGGFLGAVVQTLMSTLQLAGEVIAQTTGLTNALVDDPVTEEQSAIVIGLLDIIGVLMIFITGSITMLLISAAVDSYGLLHPGGTLFEGDMLSMASTLLSQSFAMGIRLAAPFLVFEMVFQITSGIMARLSPQLNVYFVAMPGQIALGLSILMITLPTIMLVFMKYFNENIQALLNLRRPWQDKGQGCRRTKTPKRNSRPGNASTRRVRKAMFPCRRRSKASSCSWRG